MPVASFKTTLKVHTLVAMGYLYNFANEAVLFYDPNVYYKVLDYDWPNYTINGDAYIWETAIY
ncbi:hypothetical protein [Anaerocolumna sp.]|uniref:hypothetical protein n=1 Tax=Anaerocolumna sp. TaxID=2041569 RepID=UPI0028B1B7AB|nr:hypothetical protein [Anaerocolumna sp.]